MSNNKDDDRKFGGFKSLSKLPEISEFTSTRARNFLIGEEYKNFTTADNDRLEDMFDRQKAFMSILEAHDKLPMWPIDLTTKQGQRMIKEVMHELHGELFEATYTLKNRMHRVTDDREFDREHYVEELGDAVAYFMEVCIMSGISSEELYKEYCRKNKIVKERFENGY